MKSRKWNRDCKSFPDSYACEIMSSKGYGDCSECKFYEPYSRRILIIKLGAAGDVLRTTPILTALKEKHGKVQITWLVDEDSYELLKGNPYVDRLFVYNLNSFLTLKNERFDILLSLESDYPATAIANEMNAKKKFGFYHDKDGKPSCFNKASVSYLETQFSNLASINNKTTYQQRIFQICELEYKKQDYVFKLTEKDLGYAKEFSKKNKIKENDKIIGINLGGGGKRWPSKVWHLDKVKELILKLLKKTDYKIILFGGKLEENIQNRLHNEIRNGRVLKNNPDNTKREFASVINLCNCVITSDSLGMHLAAALNKKVIALFFCSPSWEIEDYGRIEKITSPFLEKYYFTNEYAEELVKSISVDEVFNQIKI